MTKEHKDKIRTDPILWAKFQSSRSEQKKSRLKKLKSNPIEYEKYKEKKRLKYDKMVESKKLLKEKRRAASIYWQSQGHIRYKRRFFARLAKYTNQRCSIGKRLRAVDLWSIAKKQRMVCPITGEKLTRENISIDHIVPISNFGTNDPHNLRFVTITVNTAKGAMSDAEFISFCQKIAARHSAQLHTNNPL